MDCQIIPALFEVRQAATELADSVGRTEGQGGGSGQERRRQEGGGCRHAPAVRRCPTPHPPRESQLAAQGGSQFRGTLRTIGRFQRQATFDQARQPRVDLLVSLADGGGPWACRECKCAAASRTESSPKTGPKGSVPVSSS